MHSAVFPSKTALTSLARAIRLATMPASARNVCFTWNNYPSTAEYDLKKLSKSCKYMVYQFEHGALTNTPHIQGYFEHKTGIKFVTLRTWFGPSFHYESRLGSQSEAANYCKKPETRDAGTTYVEIGELNPSRQGQRSDLDTAVNIVATDGIRGLKEQLPGMFVRYHAGMEKLAAFYKVIPKIDDFIPRKWQRNVLNLLEKPANRRDVIWVTDRKGNTGKSTLSDYLLCNMAGLPLSGRFLDMAYMWNDEEHKIGIFDIPRSTADNTKHLFQMAEGLKNGLIISQKYSSCVKKFPFAHVIFFSNEPPATEYLSADRWIIFDLDELYKTDKELHKPWPECAGYIAPSTSTPVPPAADVAGGSNWHEVSLLDNDENARDGFPGAYC